MKVSPKSFDRVRKVERIYHNLERITFYNLLITSAFYEILLEWFLYVF